MKKVYRRVMLFTSVVVFLLAAPLLVLYGIGYRTESLSVDPLPVGVVLVDAVPRRANVYVNGELRGRAPEALPNLPAGAIDISVELEGYLSWEKRIEVQSGRTVEVRDIRLFPESVNPVSIASTSKIFSIAPNRRVLATVNSQNQLTFIDEQGRAVSSAPYQLSAAPIALLWSPQSSHMLVNTQSRGYYLITLDRPGVVQPFTVLRGAKDVVWDPRIPGRILYRDIQGDLAALSIVNGQSTQITNDVATFATSSRSIYALTTAGKVHQYSLQGELHEAKLSIPTVGIKQLLITPDAAKAYLLQDGSLWAETDDGELLLVAERALTAQWSPNGLMLLAQTDENTVHIFNAADERSSLPLHESQLIVRLSQPMRDPQWFAGGRHFIFQTNDALVISEIDTRDHPINYQVDTSGLQAATTAVGENGESVFYLKSDGDTTSLFRAQLVLDE